MFRRGYLQAMVCLLVVLLGHGRIALASYTAAFERVAPAVVYLSLQGQPIHSYQHFYHHRPEMGSSSEETASGCAVVIDREGDLLTNYHVIRSAKTIMMQTRSGAQYPATLLGADLATDLALLHVRGVQLSPAPIGDVRKLQVGDIVLAVGHPFGLRASVTQGIVSGLARHGLGINPLEHYIQTDAAINPGNSGGALIDEHGAVVGINTAIYSYSGGYEGIGFAIPIDRALRVASALKQHGTVMRGWLGLMIRDTPQGIEVVQVDPRSPAAQAKIQPGDRLTHLGKARLSQSHQLIMTIADQQPGEVIELQILREGKARTERIRLANRALS